MENINQAVYLEKLTTPTLAEDIDTLAVCESYSGVDNPIHFKTLNVAQFSCGFDIIVENYPFGRQNCTMSFFITKNDNGLTNLTVGNLTDHGPTTSGQYVISGWTMQTGNISDQNGKVITVYLGLSRNFLSIFMVVYLPLIIMNVLNQASFYLTTEDKLVVQSFSMLAMMCCRYQMVITVNITCLLALASFYMGVATSLPSTANIKPVEYYLIYNLVYPFLTILLAVYIQVKGRGQTLKLSWDLHLSSRFLKRRMKPR